MVGCVFKVYGGCMIRMYSVKAAATCQLTQAVQNSEVCAAELMAVPDQRLTITLNDVLLLNKHAHFAISNKPSRLQQTYATARLVLLAVTMLPQAPLENLGQGNRSLRGLLACSLSCAATSRGICAISMASTFPVLRRAACAISVCALWCSMYSIAPCKSVVSEAASCNLSC